MDIVGICRFSLVGHGDWKIYRGKTQSEAAAMHAKQVEVLFAPERIERRLETLKYITLASLAAQTDQNFTFLVLASEMMPERYRQQLQEICAEVPQVRLRFFPIISATDAQSSVFKELGFEYSKTLQFRLDDDDCVSVDYIERKRHFATPLCTLSEPFSISFSDVLFLHHKGGDHADAHLRYLPFMSAGAAVMHNHRSVFSFGHFALGRRFPAFVIPGGCSLVIKHDSNDTRFNPGAPNMRRLLDPEVSELVAKHFPFLSKEGKALTGIGS